MNRHERWDHIADPYLVGLINKKHNWEDTPAPWWLYGAAIAAVGTAVFFLWAVGQ